MAGGMAGRPRILILGGGFAGLAACRAIDGADVTLVDRDASFDFLPNVHELLSGVKRLRDVRLPLADVVARAGHRFLHDEVMHLDVPRRCVETRGGARLAWDALVLASGARTATYGVSGVEAHASVFRDARDCAAIATRLGGALDPVGPRAVTIVGGGFEGVETLGEILRRWRGRRALTIRVIERQDRLLPEAPPGVDEIVRAECAGWPVDVVTGAEVASITPDAVELASGRRFGSNLTIWTGGPEPAAVAASLGRGRPGWVPVDDHLRSLEYAAVFVAGDAASLDPPLPKQAYHALDMGEVAGRNALRLVRGEPLVPYRPAPKPMLVAFGDLTTLLVAGDLVVAHPVLAFAKELVCETVMTRLDLALDGRSAGRLAGRLAQSVREIAWPMLTTPHGWLGFGDLRIRGLREAGAALAEAGERWGLGRVRAAS